MLPLRSRSGTGSNMLQRSSQSSSEASALLDDENKNNNNHPHDHPVPPPLLSTGRAILTGSLLVIIPRLVTGYLPFGLFSLSIYIKAYWTAQMRCPLETVMLFTSLETWWWGNRLLIQNNYNNSQVKRFKSEKTTICQKLFFPFQFLHPVTQLSLCIYLVVLVLFIVLGQIQYGEGFRSTWWNPLLPIIHPSFRFYEPSELALALKGMCWDERALNLYHDHSPLCLKEHQWQVASSGALSSKNAHDVATVLKGVDYVQSTNQGMIVNVLARNTRPYIAALQANVEALRQIFPKVAVVIFENDSTDGTRQAFQTWANTDELVDLIDCGPEHPNCQFREGHRYHSAVSILGRMGEYRQRILDYILSQEKFKNHYSHMLILDHDLGCSISPLGILHTLGQLPHNPVAITGEMVMPGSWGTMVFPYDLAGFRATPSPATAGLIKWHERFCGIHPPDDKWANMCEAPSPFQLNMALWPYYRHRQEPYVVDSSFNGAALYPIKVLRESHAKYDTGPYGQRNEHIGFHLSIKNNTQGATTTKPVEMHVNPKWKLHVDPMRPPGPDHHESMHENTQIIVDPKVIVATVAPILTGTWFVVHCTTCLIIYSLDRRQRKRLLKSNSQSLPLSPDHNSDRSPPSGGLSRILFRTNTPKTKRGV